METTRTQPVYTNQTKPTKQLAHTHKNDGYKTIDLVLPEYMLNIEVDGSQHNFDAKQAFSDLARSRHSRQKGWETIRFPNSVIRNDVKKVAKEIEEIVEDLEEDEF